VRALIQFPDELEVRIDTARGGLIKRRDDGSVDYVSPLPCPFNYGSVPSTLANDGDREDAIVLGERINRGNSVRVRVLGRVRFMDGGVADDKWICGEALTLQELKLVVRFFRFYAWAKRILNALRGERRLTHYGGVELPDTSGDKISYAG
jgi:inorganic pyrophosphatase